MSKFVYGFSASHTEGSREMKSLLGGKGANLAEMSSLGLRVPPGFTISTEACLQYLEQEQFPKDLKKQVTDAISIVEKDTGKTFGDAKNPLLFSVRSGAKVSMPGMMDTVLNLGLNDQTVEGLAKLTSNPRLAWDSYRRFIQMYANVVMGFNSSMLESTLEDLKEACGVSEDTGLEAEDLKELVEVYKKIILEESGLVFPTDPMEQLWKAITAVFSSWNNPRAIKYREINSIDHEIGTAVNVQSMVFGNMGDNSATGVCFTRDPSTGEKKFFGEYLLNAQGEDVVAGIRTPSPINNESKNNFNKDLVSLEEAMPEAFSELTSIYKKLESHYKDMQDIEFTIENGTLYLLQTRNGKRTTTAAVRIAVELASEGILTKKEALMRISPSDLNQLLHPRLDPEAEKKVITNGLPASPGAASGVISFSSEKAQQLSELGEKVLLVRQETSPEDIGGMAASCGILTARGGMTSHAAVVARGMGTPCVAGCSELDISHTNETLTIGAKVFKAGDFLTIDGSTGEVFEGQVPTKDAELTKDFERFMSWADEVRKLSVRTNADNPNDSAIAVRFGAEGVGLCRTEHMFFETERIMAVREMIFAESLNARKTALNKLEPVQKEDFFGIFSALDGKPVNIRLLDPPLHEFLPHGEEEQMALADYLNISIEDVKDRVAKLHEFNPMLGHRGCRLGITYPEIYIMQVRAIIEAALMAQEKGVSVKPEIMIPLISTTKEFSLLKDELEKEIQDVFREQNESVPYKIGTMIEIPRAALLSEEIAKDAAFFSFGTNDLTQTVFGLSRDDSGKFIGEYLNKSILSHDPFVSIDQEGVGQLVSHSCTEGRKGNPSLHLGVCGEHGGDPNSIDFFHRIGLHYVSCSPFRVPIARLAAAQAVIKENGAV